MTKKEIVKQISEQADLTQLKTKEVVQMTFDAIIDTLVSEGRIELRNFGVFEVKLRKPRRARNPRTNETVEVEAKFVVTFQPGKIMEERVRKFTPSGVASRLAIVNDDDEDDEEMDELTNSARVPVTVGAMNGSRDRHSEAIPRHSSHKQASSRLDDVDSHSEKPLKPR